MGDTMDDADPNTSKLHEKDNQFMTMIKFYNEQLKEMIIENAKLQKEKDKLSETVCELEENVKKERTAAIKTRAIRYLNCLLIMVFLAQIMLFFFR